MWQQLQARWHPIRILRLILGIMIIIQGIQNKAPLIAVAGFILTGLALFHTGCCAAGTGCSVNRNRYFTNKKDDKNEQLEWEEVVE